MMEENKQSNPASDTRFFIIIGALLVVIIATLATLWMRERGRCRDLVYENAKLAEAIDKSKAAAGLQMMMAKALAGEGQGGAKTVDRELLSRQTLTVDGRQREALMLPAAVAKRLGFEAGDLIIVGTGSTTQGTGGAPNPTSSPS